tara:strand:- start:3337 stop:3804 length:468 start_codon:yes stop_codon:yes gene_type:complete
MSHSHENNEQSWGFAKELYFNSITKAEEIAHKEYEDKQELEKNKQKIKHDKFIYLTDKYFDNIINSIFYKSNKGERIKYINFDKNDFKANFPGLGYPKEFMRSWFDELSDPNSKYLPDKYIKDYFKYCDSNKKISLQGIDISIWNNSSNTVVFKW